MGWNPRELKTIEGLGIGVDFVQEMILKILYVQGVRTGKSIANTLKIPFHLLEEEILGLKKRDLLSYVGAEGAGGYAGMTFDLTPKGRERTKEILAARSYVGPLPITLNYYEEAMENQSLDTQHITHEEISNLFKDMVLDSKSKNQIGPAINSGGPILFFGEPGNGKTMVAEKIIHAFTDTIFIPYCIYIDGQIIKYFDEKVHSPVKEFSADSRWVEVKRPFVVVGGELTLEMLDLIYKDDFKYYEAPFQLKSNCGLLLIDDFGRQIISPKDLLNRWIYPLEKSVDYLTLVTGKKIEVPFNQMLVFSTNISPKKLGDTAFLRRIKYKIEVLGPSLKNFKILFSKECEKNNIEFDEQAFHYMVEKHFKSEKRSPRGCHSRDLVSHIKDFIKYYKQKNILTPAAIDFACDSYF